MTASILGIALVAVILFVLAWVTRDRSPRTRYELAAGQQRRSWETRSEFVGRQIEAGWQYEVES